MFLLKVFVTATLVLAALSAPFFDLNGRIVGGEETTIEKFPYQVSLRYDDMHMCGGSILDEYTILTAAHCTAERNHSHLSVRVGSAKHNEGQSFSLSEVIENPKWNPKTVDSDVAILKLSKPLVFGIKIQPIPLQPSGVEVPERTTSYVSGWGLIKENGQVLPEVLRMTDVDVVSNKECSANYGPNMITSNMLCAFKLGHDSCQMDSGGPLVANGKLIGVVSWGMGCANPKYPGVYTKVSEFNKWIVSYM